MIFVCTGAWDVCLLHAKLPPNVRLCPLARPPLSPALYPARSVFVMGHALFGPPANLRPTVTAGVLSRVVYLPKKDRTSLGDEQPVLLQTDAAVHSGNSGGLLAGTDGEWLGLVTSNVKHSWQPPPTEPPAPSKATTVIPHLNLSIPARRLLPLFDYCRTQDVAALHALNRPNPVVVKVWTLEDLNPPPEPVLREGPKYLQVLRMIREQHEEEAKVPAPPPLARL